MPLKCFDTATESFIRSYELDDRSWGDLVAENRAHRHLCMRCCDALVTPKVSKRGTRFFAHKTKGYCTSGPESEAHLRLKEAVALSVRKIGWMADVEVEGQSPDGEAWIADVLATRGRAKVAIEIQWSRQSDDELRRRQARYQVSGVRGIWLVRRPTLLSDPDIPVAEISQKSSGDFEVSVGSTLYQKFGLHEFLEAAFSGRLKFGLVAGCLADASVFTGTMFCWRCGAETKIVTSLLVDIGPDQIHLRVPELAVGSALHRELIQRLPPDVAIGRIKTRSSNTQKRRYLSNGCAHCDALIGEFYEHEADHDDTPIVAWRQTIDDHWLEAIRNTELHDPYWGVLRF